MRKDVTKSALFRLEITTPTKGEIIKVKDTSYQDAWDHCEIILKDNPDDEYLQTELKNCMQYFGFQGIGGRGYNITISAYRPTLDIGEFHTCPERTNGFGPWEREKGLDKWEIRGDDKCCSFCGSLHPDRVIELIKERGIGIINPSTKGYKLYIDRPEIPNAGFGGIKYYRWHDTEEFLAEFKKLL